MIEKREFYINGAWVPPSVAQDAPVIDPSTAEPVATISLGGRADADAAVQAARDAFPDWAATPHKERLRLLSKFYGLYKKRKADMVEAIIQEMGAPRSLAETAQFGAGAVHIKETLRVLESYKFRAARGDARIFREPVGVAALITPWNWPMNQVTLKVIPALGVGCTVVLKPSEIAPLSSLLFAEMIDEAGLPPGVFNLVNGDGATVGAHLSAHPDVDMVSFTGSTRAGTAISKAAADTIKRVSLELGGKGANVIFADADDEAVARGVAFCFENSGQSCNAPTRMLVERPIYDAAVETAQRLAEAQVVGSAHDSGDHIGPVVSALHWNKIQGLIKAGIDEGARLVAGGTGMPEGLTKGYYVKPTVFADVTNDMRIAQEEIFGPVLSILPFETEEEALQIANDTPYGLGNYVQTSNKRRAERMARGLRSGMVEVNGVSLGVDTPFGGYKQSGNGREGSVWGIEEFLEVKAVAGLA